MKRLRLYKGKLNMLEIMYVLLPLALFLFGWTKWYIVLGCFVVAFVCYKKLFRSFSQNDESIDISFLLLVAGCLLLLFVGYSCGWGRWVKQPKVDYEKHNAILADLTSESWPVYYCNNDEHAMLTYYIGQYLVPAFIGKLANSFRVAEIAVFVWSSLGLVLVWLHLLSSLKISEPKRQIGSALFLVLFALPLFLAELVGELLGLPVHISTANTDWFAIVDEVGVHLQYSSNYVLLNWVYPQTIVCWITTLLLLDYRKEIRYYVPLALPTMLFSALSFIGIVIVAASLAMAELIRERRIKAWIKRVLSVENLLYTLTIGVVMLLYFAGNVFSEKPPEMQFYLSPITEAPLLFAVFYAFCILPYPLCLFWWCKKDDLFWIATGILLILPLLHLGRVNDLMMRASIPALLILMYEILKTYNEQVNTEHERVLEKNKQGRKKAVLLGVLVLCLLFGVIFPVSNMVRNMKTSKGIRTTELYTYGTMGIYADRKLEEDDEVRIKEKVYNYFTYDVEKTMFYRYIARERITDKD